MEYKIKHQDGTSIIEDIGGGVSMDELIDLFLKGDDSWSEAIYSDFHSYDSAWHEHGPTDIVDTLVLEDGTEKDITVSAIEASDSENLSDKASLGGEIFFSCAVSHESGEWEFESFELEHEFDEKFLQADRNIDSKSILSMYVYNNPDTDEIVNIEGEFVEGDTSGTDITLYVNTKDGVVECDDFSVWREEMEEKGIDPSLKEEVKKYLIEKYNIDVKSSE
jgi:hypothetical protein